MPLGLVAAGPGKTGQHASIAIEMLTIVSGSCYKRGDVGSEVTSAVPRQLCEPPHTAQQMPNKRVVSTMEVRRCVQQWLRRGTRDTDKSYRTSGTAMKSASMKSLRSELRGWTKFELPEMAPRGE